MPTRLMRSFYEQNTLLVAQELLGMRLVHIAERERLAGIIIETEAYRGEDDLGCHARAGLTRRTRVMYGPAGHAYVYFTYGKHWMLNFVTEAAGFPAAVLIRAVLPSEGLQTIASRRNHLPEKKWADGPAKLCQAFNIDNSQNGLDLCASEAELFVETGIDITGFTVTANPRVGLYTVPEPWKSIPWNFSFAIRANLQPD